jgi:hypothetical protein
MFGAARLPSSARPGSTMQAPYASIYLRLLLLPFLLTRSTGRKNALAVVFFGQGWCSTFPVASSTK